MIGPATVAITGKSSVELCCDRTDAQGAAYRCSGTPARAKANAFVRATTVVGFAP